MASAKNRGHLRGGLVACRQGQGETFLRDALPKKPLVLGEGGRAAVALALELGAAYLG
jgi:hypothetical protein